jgi:hypothetical protein
MMTETVTQEWVETVLEQHRHLRTVVADLKEFLFTPRPETGEKGSHSWAVALSQRLLSLHDELFRHFRFEEETGVMEEILENHPEAARKLKEVLGEHPELLRQLRQIVADVLSYSEGVSPEDPQIRRRITDLLDVFGHHEEEENHLFQRLEYRDVAAAD